MSDPIPCLSKTPSELAREWDRIAKERHRQIVSGEDLSFDLVLVPAMFEMLKGVDTSSVLDVGAGTGHFTARLARLAKRVIAIEPSLVSLQLAEANCAGLSNVQLRAGSLEEAADELRGTLITTAAASMTLMTTPDLGAFARALSSILPVHSHFVATFTHPWFWPQYWGYDTAKWFDYSKETFVEAAFTISRRRTEARTTHVHRPLAKYITTFSDWGFDVEWLVEPIPPMQVQNLYPKPWLYPRFIGIRWVKSRNHTA